MLSMYFSACWKIQGVDQIAFFFSHPQTVVWINLLIRTHSNLLLASIERSYVLCFCYYRVLVSSSPSFSFFTRTLRRVPVDKDFAPVSSFRQINKFPLRLKRKDGWNMSNSCIPTCASSFEYKIQINKECEMCTLSLIHLIRKLCTPLHCKTSLSRLFGLDCLVEQQPVVLCQA